MIVNPNGKIWGISFFQNGKEISFSWEFEKKYATKHDIKEDFLRELIEIWISSPNTTFVVVV